MTKWKWMGLLVLVGVLGMSSPQPAVAGSSTDAALGLGAFAVLNQFLRGETIFQGFGHRETVIVQPPPTVIYAPPPPPAVYYAPPPVVYYAPPPVVYYAPPPAVYYAPPPAYYRYGYYQYGHYKRHHRHEDHDD
jgi:hypothetical protein